MAGLLSLLPGAISGIANVVEGISKQKPAGEVITSGLRGLVGAPQATDFLPTQQEQDEALRKPMTVIRDDTMQGSVPRMRFKQVPIREEEEDDLDDKLDELDDRIDEKLGAMQDKAEADRLRGEVEQLEDTAEEMFPDDEEMSLKKEIELKEAFLGKKRKRRRRRRRR